MSDTESLNHTTDTVGMDMHAPFGVYVNGEQVAEFDRESDAQMLFNQLTGRVLKPA